MKGTMTTLQALYEKFMKSQRASVGRRDSGIPSSAYWAMRKGARKRGRNPRFRDGG